MHFYAYTHTVSDTIGSNLLDERAKIVWSMIWFTSTIFFLPLISFCVMCFNMTIWFLNWLWWTSKKSTTVNAWTASIIITTSCLYTVMTRYIIQYKQLLFIFSFFFARNPFHFRWNYDFTQLNNVTVITLCFAYFIYQILYEDLCAHQVFVFLVTYSKSFFLFLLSEWFCSIMKIYS